MQANKTPRSATSKVKILTFVKLKFETTEALSRFKGAATLFLVWL